MLNTLSDSVYVSNTSGIVQYVNFSFLKFYNLKIEDIHDKHISELSETIKDFEIFLQEDQRVIQTSKPQEKFYDFRGKSSYQMNQARSSKTPLLDEKDKLVGVIGSITHIDKSYISSNLLARGVKHYQNIQQLTLSISKLNSEQAILWELVEECANLLSLDDCVIYLYNESDNTLTQRAAFGTKEKGGVILSPVSLKMGQGIVGKAAAIKQTILVDDLTKSEDYFEDNFKSLSEISVPIIFQEKIIGVIDSESAEFGFYNIKHKDFLEAIASIAALKIAELRSLKQVKEKEQYLNQILESPRDLMAYSIDKEYRYKTFNQNHASMIKNYFDIDIELGMNVLENVADETEREEYKMSFEKALNGSDFSVLEKYGGEGDQGYSYLDKLYSPLYSIDGKIMGVTVLIRDVTEEKKVTLKLEERERLIQTINENIKDGIFRYSIERGFLYSNRALLELFGLTPPGEMKVDIREYHVFKNQHLKIYNEILQNGFLENREVHFKRTDGSTFWGLLDCTLSEHDEEQVVDGVITNITIMKEMSQNLIKANSEMDQLVYRTSHDLRAPIASLLGLESLLSNRVKDLEQRELLGLMKGQLNQLDSIIMDIITYRKVAKMGLAKNEIDLESMINKILEGLQFMKNYEHIDINVNINSNSAFINDKHNVQVVFNNLLSNAIKYSKDGKEGRVSIDVIIDQEKVLIVISDNGIGIEEDYLNLVFNMFYRATNYATGTGLGLFIVKEAVTKLGGTIDVKSEVGKGSTFTVEIPNLLGTN